ncbi:hypothetical protein [Lewinella sp. 4G2]|uniref:hypothetical protein n=1 Tax=Lewinella sp. 4G2 TaxID=1803372 RepID=UPI0007B4DEEB|nr:hypothetical protein [Lewinella sp. 4G2]OAV44724.1 hypothetical protein A3850_009570 [Lewinella sp. 4G2]
MSAPNQRPRFIELPTTQKGTAGERIAARWFIDRGYLPYGPAFTGAHPVDNVLLSPFTGRVTAVEVKTYPRRYASAENGIDAADLTSYTEFAEWYKLPVYIVWIDQYERRAYGALLRDLAPHARPDGDKVYFSLQLMQVIFKLTLQQVSQLPPLPHPNAYARARRFFTDDEGHPAPTT